MHKIPLLGYTKEKMLVELRGGKKTARELADSLNIQVSAARKHLETLYRLEIVREEFIQDGIGRPKKYYQLTDEGQELFPRQYERILCGVLDKLAGSDGLCESVVQEVAHEITKNMNIQENGHSGMENLIQALNEFGFDSVLTEENSAYVIISHNCPLYKAAMKHQRIVCHALHDEMIKSALQTKGVRLEQCLSNGDNLCKHVIEK